MKIHRILPPLVRELCYGRSAWIVGSAAKALIEGTTPESDYDIIVAPEDWNEIATSLATHRPTANYLGGWKCLTPNNDPFSSDWEVDVWPDTIDRYLLRTQRDRSPQYLLHPKSGLKITVENL